MRGRQHEENFQKTSWKAKQISPRLRPPCLLFFKLVSSTLWPFSCFYPIVEWPSLPDCFAPPFLSVSPFLLLNLVRRQCYAYAIGLYTRPEIKSWPNVKFCAHEQCVLPRCYPIVEWLSLPDCFAPDYSLFTPPSSAQSVVRLFTPHQGALVLGW